jgi:nicotinamide riboside transporter PnuC
MKLSDYLGFALAMGFGLWLIVFPTNVIGFYTWFHKGQAKMPQAFAVRLTGAAWIVLVTIVTLLAFTKH